MSFIMLCVLAMVYVTGLLLLVFGYKAMGWCENFLETSYGWNTTSPRRVNARNLMLSCSVLSFIVGGLMLAMAIWPMVDLYEGLLV